jgi:hypothetical protein
MVTSHITAEMMPMMPAMTLRTWVMTSMISEIDAIVLAMVS